jgi:hypothetical protein
MRCELRSNDSVQNERIFLLVTFAVIIGLAAAGASQIDPGFPPSDGTF